MYQYNTDWIANTEIGLDPSNSVIKRLRCISSNRFQRQWSKLDLTVAIDMTNTYKLTYDIEMPLHIKKTRLCNIQRFFFQL